MHQFYDSFFRDTSSTSHMCTVYTSVYYKMGVQYCGGCVCCVAGVPTYNGDYCGRVMSK